MPFKCLATDKVVQKKEDIEKTKDSHWVECPVIHAISKDGKGKKFGSTQTVGTESLNKDEYFVVCGCDDVAPNIRVSPVASAVTCEDCRNLLDLDEE